MVSSTLTCPTFGGLYTQGMKTTRQGGRLSQGFTDWWLSGERLDIRAVQDVRLVLKAWMLLRDVVKGFDSPTGSIPATYINMIPWPRWARHVVATHDTLVRIQ